MEHIDTAVNRADLLTKPLKREVFEMHRRNLMNQSAASQVESINQPSVVAAGGRRGCAGDSASG